MASNCAKAFAESVTIRGLSEVPRRPGEEKGRGRGWGNEGDNQVNLVVAGWGRLNAL